MKKILLFITTLLAINFSQVPALATDFEMAEDEIDEDFMDLFVESEEEFDLLGDSENANGTIYMEGSKLNGDIFQLSVFSQDLTAPTLGISFHLLYEKNKLAFLRYEPGEFLEKGGDPFYLVKNDVSSDKIIFGETLRRNDSFPIGSGKITDFYFQILEEDKFKFEFFNGSVSTLDTVRQDLDSVFWKNFTFGEEVDSVDFAKASAFGIGDFSFSNFWVVTIMLIASIPFSYLIISFIKKNSRLKKIHQIS